MLRRRFRHSGNHEVFIRDWGRLLTSARDRDWRESKRESKVKNMPPRNSKGMISMAKELRTAEQLSDMIVSALGINEVDIQVRKDHAYGWQPIVVSSPGDLIGY
jgi:hypothetical protein